MLPEPDLAPLARALGHPFRDLSLLRDALTHRSFANEQPGRAPRDNERLEFLGDAVLSMATAGLLWERFPDASEGELTRLRADLVCEGALASLARELKVGEVLRLGRGEARSGGRDKPRLLCCALEACVGAIYLDGGLTTAVECVQSLLAGRLLTPSLGRRDHKSLIQERVQALGESAPSYNVLEMHGPDHARTFVVACSMGRRELGRGTGNSKTEAEQRAAQAAMEALEAGFEKPGG